MRLALLPIIGFKNIEGESDFVMYRNMVRDFVKQKAGIYSYMCLPRFAFGQVKQEPGMINLYTEGPQDPDDRGGFHDMLASSSNGFLDLFGPRNCQHPIDAIVTSRTDAVPNLARWVWDWRGGAELIPIVIVEPQICNIPITDRNETWLLNRTLGYLMGWPLFNTQHEKALALEAASRLLRPTLVKKLEERAKVVSCTVAFGDLDKELATTRRAEKFTLFFGGRLNAAKRADKMLQLYDEFYRGGRDVDIVVCSPKAESRIEVPPQVKLFKDMTRQDFIAQAARSHIYLNTSAAEGFSVGFVEQVYLVPVSIVPDLPWTRSLLDEAFDKHPFVYRDFDQARAMIRWAHNNYEQAAQMCAPVREYLRSRYDNTLVADQLVSVLQDTIKQSKGASKISDSQADLLWRAFKDMPEKFTFVAFWRRFKEKCISTNDVPQLGELWKWQAYEWLRDRTSDACSGPDLELVKNAQEGI